MSKPILRTAVTAALVATLALAGCTKDEPAVDEPLPAVVDAAPGPDAVAVTPPAAAPEGAAVQLVGLDLGKVVSSTGRVLEPTLIFAPGDKIHASVLTTTIEPGAAVTGKLAARWSFEDGQVVGTHEEDYRFTGPGMTTFTLEKEGPWPTGKYKVEVLIDGDLVDTREFRISR